MPLTGIGAWQDWLAALGYRADSQSAVPSLYGNSLAQSLPGLAFGLIALALVVAALLFLGRRGLAAFGLASIFASPSLWPHGFVFALPAALMLESGILVWILLGAAALNPNYWLLFYAGWLALLAGKETVDRSHPMSGTRGPWTGRRKARAAP